MKYGKEIARLCKEHPRFKNFYINYKELKRLIKTMGSTPGHAQGQRPGGKGCEGEAKFTELLKSELDKISSFIGLQYQIVNSELKKRLRDEKIEKVEPLHSLSEDIVKLEAFKKANVLGFRKITKKCDKKHGTSFSSFFMPQVENAAFGQLDLEMLFVQLGTLYANWRSQRSAKEVAGDATPSSPASASNAYLRTFLLPATEVTHAKAALLQRLSPGPPKWRQKAGDELAPPMPKPEDPLERRRASIRHMQVCEGFQQQMTHVYFDSPGGAQYAERYRRSSSSSVAARVRLNSDFSDGPEQLTFRCSWTGENKGGPDVDVNVEIQASNGEHTELGLKQGHMADFVAGKLDLDKALAKKKVDPEAKNALREVQVMIAGGSGCVVSATFTRWMFTEEGKGQNHAIIATLDEEVVFVDETRAGKDSWCYAAGQSADAAKGSRSVAFARAVLYVLVPRGRSMVDLSWLDERNWESQEVTGFSKAMHGTAIFHRNRATPKPVWMLEEGKEISTNIQPIRKYAAAAQSGTAAKAKILPKASSGLPLGRRCLALFGLGGPDVNLRVDMKTPMANERTALRWLRCAALLSTVSAYLSSRKDIASHLNAMLLGGAALLFAFWPLGDYRRRSLDMTAKKGTGQPKVDRTLPQALALCLVVILVASLVIQARYSGFDADYGEDSFDNQLGIGVNGSANTGLSGGNDDDI